MDSPRVASRLLGGRRSRGLGRSGAGGRRRRRGRLGAPAASRRRYLRQLGAGRDQAKLGDQARGEVVGAGVVLELADGVGTADRVGLAQQVVGQARIGRGAADLAERAAGPHPDLVAGDPEQPADVVVALPAEQELKHRPLFVAERHEPGRVRIGAVNCGTAQARGSIGLGAWPNRLPAPSTI